MIRETAGNVDSDIITTSPMTVKTEVGVLVASRGLMSGDVRVMSAMLAFCKFFVAEKITKPAQRHRGETCGRMCRGISADIGIDDLHTSFS